jgi:ribosomal protein S17
VLEGKSFLVSAPLSDIVEIVETRPLSRRKRWALKRVVRQAAGV